VKKVTVVGNSHIGALKTAWMELSRLYEGIEFDFFGMPGPASLKLRFLGGSVLGLPLNGECSEYEIDICRKLNSATSIDLADSDCIVYAGFEWRAEVIAQLIGMYDIEGIVETDAMRLMSAEAFASICRHTASKLPVCPDWSGWNGAPVHLLARPMPSELILKSSRRKDRVWFPLGEKGAHARNAFDIFKQEISRAIDSKGLDIIFQPDFSLADFYLTKERFSTGSLKFVNNDRHPQNEFVHMNASFGEISIRNVLENVLGIGAQSATAN
jgi:hypothetical protein